MVWLIYIMSIILLISFAKSVKGVWFIKTAKLTVFKNEK